MREFSLGATATASAETLYPVYTVVSASEGIATNYLEQCTVQVVDSAGATPRIVNYADIDKSGGNPDASPEEKSISAVLDGAEPGPGPTPEPLEFTEVQTAGQNVGCVNETALTVLRGPNLPAWDGERDLCEVRYDGQSFACEHVEQDPDGYLEFNIPIAAGEVMSDGNQCQVFARINGREGSINAEWKH